MALAQSPPDAPVITGQDPQSFARSVFRDRHPRLMEKLAAALPYGPGQLAGLRQLLDETLHGQVTRLGEDAHDRTQWDESGADFYDRNWTEIPFLWAESYFYRRLLSATGYFSGPWKGVDPFEPLKSAELHSDEADQELAAYDHIAGLAAEQQNTAMLAASLWGNTSDLGFQITAGRTLGRGLLVDDGSALWSYLRGSAPGRIDVVADNAARELLPDLMLIDHLLATGLATTLVLHLKERPYYVSDATVADANAAMRKLLKAPGAAGEAGRRLWQACADGQLTFAANPFFCGPHTYHDLPRTLSGELAGSTLTILKGDLNYRRLVGDRHWPATTSFQSLVDYFPGRAVAALRTCKSDVAVGLDAQTAARLDADEPDWRVGGTHAVIQLRRPESA